MNSMRKRRMNPHTMYLMHNQVKILLAHPEDSQIMANDFSALHSKLGSPSQYLKSWKGGRNNIQGYLLQRISIPRGAIEYQSTDFGFPEGKG